MISALKPFPQLKDSGVSWLSQVPVHWEKLRLRNAAELRVSNVDKHTQDNERPVRLCNYVDVYKNDRIRSSMPFMRATATIEEINRFRLFPGDVLITKDSESWNDIGIPALVQDASDDLLSGYHLALLRPMAERVRGDFLFRVLQSTAVSYQFHVEANGVTRYGLSHSAIKSVWLPLPPLPEQSAIVRFLDHADRRIRRYILIKQKLIKLLEEQKQAIIHRAVTRGLDPNVRLKPSGVDWLGEVPEHWEIRRLKSIARIRYGLGQPPRELRHGLPLIRATNVDHGRIVEKNLLRVDPEDVPPTRGAFLSAGEIIVVRSGAYTADSAIVPSEYEGAVAGYDMVVTVRRGLAEFVALALLSSYVRDDQLAIASMRSAQPHLNAEELGSAVVLLPPEDEQASIASYVKRAVADGNAALQLAEQEITLLREYRTRLVVDVVTGKLDVREVAATLPDEAIGAEQFDEADAQTEVTEGLVDDLDAASEEVDT